MRSNEAPSVLVGATRWYRWSQMTACCVLLELKKTFDVWNESFFTWDKYFHLMIYSCMMAFQSKSFNFLMTTGSKYLCLQDHQPWLSIILWLWFLVSQCLFIIYELPEDSNPRRGRYLRLGGMGSHPWRPKRFSCLKNPNKYVKHNIFDKAFCKSVLAAGIEPAAFQSSSNWTNF